MAMRFVAHIKSGFFVLALILAAGCTEAQTQTPAASEAVQPMGNPIAVQPATKTVTDLIADLGDADFEKRQAAERALVEIGQPAVPLLQAATTDKDPERADRAKLALQRITEQWWGEPVEGIQIQLRTDRRQWKAEEAPVLTAFARNSGKEKWWIPAVLSLIGLEVDGRSYYLPENGERLVNDFLNAGQTKPLPEIALSGWLATEGSHELLRLGPGKHTVRIRFKPGQPMATEGGEAFVREAVEAASNPVEIETLPAEAAVPATPR